MSARRVLSLILLGLSAVGCGYHLQGTGSSLPPHVKTLNIPTFKNLTTRFELDVKLTRSVIDEMVARAKVEIVRETSTADAVLIGEISAFNVNPIAFSGEGTADRYKIEIAANVVLRDNINNRVIFANPRFIYTTEYEVPEDTDFESVETEAIDKISERFARSLVVTMMEGF